LPRCPEPPPSPVRSPRADHPSNLHPLSPTRTHHTLTLVRHRRTPIPKTHRTCNPKGFFLVSDGDAMGSRAVPVSREVLASPPPATPWPAASSASSMRAALSSSPVNFSSRLLPLWPPFLPGRH
jgi:hypothetical protein